MSNSLVRNPILLDTFTSDIVISTDPITVKKVRFKSAADGDILVFEDKNGNQVLWLTQTGAGDVVSVDFGVKGFRFDGLKIDVSDCTGIGSGDLVWIYL